MFDFLRNLTKSDEESRQEFLTAYLDDRLSPKERLRFERRLAADKSLRADLERQRFVKENLRQLPRVRAPRNFTLDPSIYGRPSSRPSTQLYPVLRVATVLAVFVFVALVSVDIFALDNGLSTTRADKEMAGEDVENAADELAEAEPAEPLMERLEEAAAVAAEGLPAEEAVGEVIRESEMAVEPEEAVSELELAAPEPAESEGAIAEEADPGFSEPGAAEPGEPGVVDPPRELPIPTDGAETAEIVAEAAAEAVATASAVASSEPPKAEPDAGDEGLVFEEEVTDGLATSTPAGADLSQRQAPETVPSTDDAIAATIPEEEDEAESSLVAAEEPIFKFSIINAAEICLGLFVLMLLVTTLLVRYRARRDIV